MTLKLNLQITSFLGLMIGLNSAVFAQEANGVIAQANEYSRIFGTSMMDKVANSPSGLVNMKSVIPGFVYRGGSSYDVEGPLSETGLQNLCRRGFSAAVYAYPTKGGFRAHSVSCTLDDGTPNSIEYYGFSGESSSGRAQAMSLISQRIDRARRGDSAAHGPVFVHCWNGLHSSGNFSGSALETFCGVGHSEATDYWTNNAGSPRARAGSRYTGEAARVTVNLNDAERAALCKLGQ